MKKITKYMLILICFIIWFGALIYFKNKEDVKLQKSFPQYVLIDYLHYWKYINGEWVNIDSINKTNEVESEINWNKYDVYINNQYYNTFDYVLKDYQEYYFDEDTNSHQITQNKLLLNKDSYLNLRNFTTDVFLDEDVEIIANFMRKYNYNVNDVTVKNKYIIDEDNVIYIVSNYNEYNTSGLFYLSFYRRNNKDYLLVNSFNVDNIHYYKLYSVLDTKEKYNNFILSYGCEDSICYNMYEYNKGKYIKVIGD